MGSALELPKLAPQGPRAQGGPDFFARAWARAAGRESRKKTGLHRPRMGPHGLRGPNFGRFGALRVGPADALGLSGTLPWSPVELCGGPGL